MIFYIYDKDTRELIDTQQGFIDPLETKKQGKDIYLIPQNGTDKEPPKVGENQTVIFNGDKWEKIADFRGKFYYIGTEQHEMKKLGDLPNGATFEPVELKKTFNELKSDKLTELANVTNKYDNQLVCTDMIIKSSLGFKVNADLRSQNNLRGLITVGVEPVNFVDATNTVQSLSLEQLNILLNECALNGESLYLQKWSYKAQIENAQSIDELNNIKFNFTMRDFNE